MLNFIWPTPAWETSGFADLPRIPPGGDDRLRDYCLIAGGLALVLSRCPPDVTRRRFRATAAMYQALKNYRVGRASISPQLVSDVSHEVAEFTDQATRNALRRRMKRPAAQER